MRIGIITIGSQGDVQPYIALGTAFKRAGYEVRLLTHGAFAGAVHEEGLEFADLGVDPRTVMEQVMQEGAQRCWQATQDVDALLLNPLGIYIGIPLAHKRGIPAF